MSVVGPRPLLVRYLPLYNAHQARRHEVRPGFTGYAQVHGRNAISWEEKFDLDVEYVDHVTFLRDWKIIFATVDIEIGAHVIINLDCTIGHDARIADFVTIYPSVNVSGFVATVILLNAGAGIQLVKLASSCIFLTKPLILKSYVNRNYNIVKIKKTPKNAIPNMWNGLAQHVTVTVSSSIGNVLLTIFTMIYRLKNIAWSRSSLWQILIRNLHGLSLRVRFLIRN